MSRKIQLIDKYDGGLNESASPAKIEKNQVAEAVDVQFSKHGTIQTLGGTKYWTDTNDHANPIGGSVQEGRGLYQYNSPLSLVANDTSITSEVHVHGSNGTTSLAIGTITYLKTFPNWIIMQQLYNPHVFTFSLTDGSGGSQSLGAVTIDVTQTDSTHAQYDNLGLEHSSTRNLERFYELVAAASNAVGSTPITATAVPGGVLYEPGQGVTTYNGHSIRVTYTNQHASNYPYFQMTTSWAGNPELEVNVPPPGGWLKDAGTGYTSMTNASGPVAHVHKLTVAKSGSESRIFVADIGIDEGGTDSIQTVSATNSGNASTCAIALKDAINADAAIINADNIGPSSANTDFGGESSGVITLTSDLVGENGVFSCDAYVVNDSPVYEDKEFIVHIDSNNYLRVYQAGLGVVSSGLFLGATSDLAALWSDGNALPGFYDAGGILRIFDTDFSHSANDNKILKYINNTGLFTGFGGTTLAIQKWHLTNQDVEWRYTFETSGTGSRGIKTRVDEAVTTAADKQMAIRIEATGSGTWGLDGAKKYKFYASAVRVDGSETLPELNLLFNTATFLSFTNNQLKLTVFCDPGAIDSETNFVGDFDTKAFNIYWSSEDDGYGEKNLLCEIDFKDGIVRADGGTTAPWIAGGIEQISATNDRTFAGASNWTNAAGDNAFASYDETTSGQLTVTPDDVSDVQYAYLDGANWEDVETGIPAMIEGETYRLSYDIHISAYTKGTLSVGLSNDATPAVMQTANTYTATNGTGATATLDFVYAAASHEMITIHAAANTVLTADFDNFSLKNINVCKINDGTNDYIQFEDPAEVDTFRGRNMYNWQGTTLTAKYKTATVAGRRAFIGNVLVDGIQHNDTIIYSPFDQLDVFPYPENRLSISSTDGSSITALENTGDRVWEFKNNILYVHNIAGGDPSSFFVEATLPQHGCAGENKIVKTRDGLFWVNSNSGFHFTGDLDDIIDTRYYESDGGKAERITHSTWNGTFYKSSTIVGYDAGTNSVILKDAASTNNGKTYIYNISDDSWTTGSAFTSIKGKKCSNYITTNDGEMVNIVTSNYHPTDGDHKLKTNTNTGTS